MATRFLSTAFVAAALSTGVASAQNDECTGAIAATSGVSTAFDTTAATTSAPVWPCAGSGGPDLWYSYTTTAANQLLEIELCGSSYDTSLQLFEGTCGTLVSRGCNDDSCGLQSTISTPTGPAGTTYYFRIGGFSGATGTGTFLVTESAGPCPGYPDDNLEDNDTCATAVSIMANNYVGLAATLTDPDFYSLTFGPDEILDVTIFDTAAEDLDLRLYDAACGLIQDYNTDGFSGILSGPQPRTVVFEVYIDPGFSGMGCLDYDMDVVLSPDPCANPVDDMFEENDTCQTASAIAPGNYTGLYASMTDSDFYAVTFGPDEIMDVTVFDSPSADLNLRAYDSNCALVQSSTSDVLNSVASGPNVVTMIVEVYVNSGTMGCLNYDMDIAISADPCATGTDDNLEDNDTCQTAAAIMPGNFTGLYCSLADSDYYEVMLQPGDILSVSVVDTASEDLDLETFDSGCNSVTVFNTDSFSYTNNTGSPEAFVYEVFVDPAFPGIGCLNYDMLVSVGSTPDCSTPDALEGGDDCPSALPLGDGFYTDLNVEELDNDYYLVGVDPGATLTVDIFFIDLFADTDLYLWDPTIACDTNVAGPGTGTGALDVGFSVSDNEQVSWTNTTGGPVDIVIEVDMFTSGGCNGYDMMIDGSNGASGGIGTNYCMANPNSTGQSGEIRASGSRVAAQNDVTLSVSGLPPFSFGFFITSLTPGFVPNPAGSQGNLCLGGAIGRYVGPGQIQQTQQSGEFSLTIDLTQTPQPNGFVSAMSGESWNYQAWHRDSVGGMATSNFTDGVTIDYL